MKQPTKQDQLVGYYISKGYSLKDAYNLAYSGVRLK